MAETGSHKRCRPLPRSWPSLVEPWVAAALGCCLLAVSRDFMHKQESTEPSHHGRFGSANGHDRAQVLPSCAWESLQVKARHTTGPPPPPHPQLIAAVIDTYCRYLFTLRRLILPGQVSCGLVYSEVAHTYTYVCSIVYSFINMPCRLERLEPCYCNFASRNFCVTHQQPDK